MAADGTAPGYIDTAMTTDVSRIADPVVRLVISNMVARQDFALQLQGQQMAEILTGQRSMKQSMDHMMDVMSQISSVHHFEERQHSLQPFPSVIHADSPVASSQSSSKSSNQGRSSSVGSCGDALVCPFCGVPHYSEKSHFQHVDRLGQRIGKLYYGDCVFPENHYSLRHFEGASVGDKMFAFCRQYCSKISSSKSSGIDKDRAAALASWLSSLQLEPQ